ncbi:MAG TPA: hypothetical protein VL086_19290 [Candidatus Nitrosotalea sp.]|nr:hypothetical protein [Candidatus Nitrosotalea sp.]
MRRVTIGLLLAVGLAGCGSGAFGPAYTEEEQAQFCALRGGWWRPDELRDGHCEFEAAGFM